MSGSASADTCEPMSEMADAVHSLRNAGWRQRLAEWPDPRGNLFTTERRAATASASGPVP